jgi:hypothetical protein
MFRKYSSEYVHASRPDAAEPSVKYIRRSIESARCPAENRDSPMDVNRPYISPPYISDKLMERCDGAKVSETDELRGEPLARTPKLT